MKTLSHNAALTANAGGQGLDVETLPVKGRRTSLDVPFHRTLYLNREFLVQKLCPTGVIVEVTRHERDINVTALTNGLAVIHGFEDHK